MLKKAFAVVALTLLIAFILHRIGFFDFGDELSGILPDEGAPGDLITLSGPDFRAVNGVVVNFNELKVAPEGVFAKGLSVRVPEGAKSGLVSVSAGGKTTRGLFFKVKPAATGKALPPGHPAMEGAGAMGKGMGGMGMGMTPPAGEAPKQVGMPGQEAQAAAETPNAHEFYSAETAKMAPDFALKDAKGKLVKLSDFKGKVIALNFWASWCPPCLEEVPSLERLTKRAATMDLVVLAVSVDKTFEEVHKALPNLALNVLLDPKGDTAHLYGTMKFPETWMIDKNGKIVARFIGARDWDSPLFERLFGMLIKGEALPMMGR